jgi:predicted ferric reductase
MDDPKAWRHVHATLTVVWFLAVVPTMLWLKESVLWVALMSCWANAAAHFSAWQGSRSEDSDS